MSVSAVVAKSVAVPVKGFVLALNRLREVAGSATDPDAVYIYVFETANWVASFSDNARLSGDSDVQAVSFVRNRNDHHWASVTFFDESHEKWVWRPASQMPEHPKYPDEKLKRLYKAQLENRPVLEVFERLEPKILSLAPR